MIKEGGFLKKKEKEEGALHKSSLLLPPDLQNRGGAGGRPWAGGPGGTREAGKEGKRERRVRGFDSPPWLGLGWSEEAAPRWPSGGGSYGGGGGAVGSGRGAGGGSRGCGSEGDAEDPFIGRERQWREGAPMAGRCSAHGQ